MAVVADKEQVAKQGRIAQRMRTELPYQSKSSRGLSRIEAAKGKVDRVVKQERLPYRPCVKLCIGRARLITESYKQTEGEPIILKRAKALVHCPDNWTLYILPLRDILTWWLEWQDLPLTSLTWPRESKIRLPPEQNRGFSLGEFPNWTKSKVKEEGHGLRLHRYDF